MKYLKRFIFSKRFYYFPLEFYDFKIYNEEFNKVKVKIDHNLVRYNPNESVTKLNKYSLEYMFVTLNYLDFYGYEYDSRFKGGLFSDEILSEVIFTIGTFDIDLALQKYIAAFIDLIEFFFYYWFFFYDQEFFFFSYLLNLNQKDFFIFFNLKKSFFSFKYFFNHFSFFFFYFFKKFFKLSLLSWKKEKNNFFFSNWLFFTLKENQFLRWKNNKISIFFSYYFNRLKLYHYFWYNFNWNNDLWWFFLYKRNYFIVSFYKDFRLVLNKGQLFLSQYIQNFSLDWLFLKSMYFFTNIHYRNQLNQFFIPILYVKSTLSNVFVYIIIDGKIIWKKSCGELTNVFKKGRRQISNVITLANDAIEALKYFRFYYMFFFFKVFLNGVSSLWSPICFSLNYYLNSYNYKNNLLKNKIKFNNKKKKNQSNFKFFYQEKKRYNKNRNKFKFWKNFFSKSKKKYMFYKIIRDINFIRKYYFKLLYIKDVTSWPFNGCKTKGKYIC